MDLRAESQALMQEVRSGRFVEAIAMADRLIASAGDWDDPQAELLLGMVMMTRLGLRAGMGPDEEVVAECEEVFARYRDSPEPAGALIALGALKTELGLLLQDPEDERIADAVTHISSVYAAARGHPNQTAIAAPVLVSIDRLTGRGHAPQALQLARDLIDRLASSENDQERQAAASAQLWIVIAMTYGGERFPFAGDLPDLGELVQTMLHKSVSELAQVSPAFGAMDLEMDRCCDLGQAGVDAADSLLAEFRSRDGWLQAEIVAHMIKLSILEHLGRTEETNQAIRELVALAEGAQLPGIERAVNELRRNLA